MAEAADTRNRILAAATEEFAEHGLAGARVDRIAAASGASKPMLYAYYGSKDGLFDAVFHAHVIGNADRVPFVAEDLPGYAGRLYDDYLADPALPRLVLWKRLEREPTGYLYGGLEDRDAEHLADIRREQRAGSIRTDMNAADIWSMLIAVSATWAASSITSVALADDDAGVHSRRRRALESAVRARFVAG
jgi:AcrR family transcriptional regulator